MHQLKMKCVLRLQVWNLTNCKLKANLAGHQGYINTVTVSPDGSLCASGGKVLLFYATPSFMCLAPNSNLTTKWSGAEVRLDLTRFTYLVLPS